MPGSIRMCFLCGQSERGSQSVFMTIDCLEQESRIGEGYLKRHKIEIANSLIGKQVHRRCYRSILKRQSLASIRSVSHPRKYASHRKHNKLKPRTTSMTVMNPNVPCTNTDNPINIFSSDCLPVVNNDKENSPARIEKNNVRNRLERKSSICSSNFQRSKPFCDLTNLDFVPPAITSGVDQSSLDFSTDEHGCYCEIVREQSLTTISNNSPEEYIKDCESDQISCSSAFYSSNIPSPILADSDLRYTTSAISGIERNSTTMTNFHEASSDKQENTVIIALTFVSFRLHRDDEDFDVKNQVPITDEDDDEDFDVINQVPFTKEDDDDDFDAATQWYSTNDNGDESAPSSAVTSDNDDSDSHNDHVMYPPTYLHSCSTSTSFQHTFDAKNSSILNIILDHNYCKTSSNHTERTMTPKRRKRSRDYQLSPITSPSSTVHKSPQIGIPIDSEPVLPTTPQSTIRRLPRPRARFLKRFRPRSSSFTA